MNNKFLILTLCVLSNFCSAQYKIAYDYIISVESPGNTSTIKIDCDLLIDKNYSVFTKDRIYSGVAKTQYSDSMKSLEQKTQSENKFKPGDSIGYAIAKDFKNGLMNRRFLNSNNQYVKVEQKIKSFDYKILDEFKDILGYKCQKATVIFEERNYELWFTDKININDGPWVFCGLPGLILEVKTTGGKHQFVVTSMVKYDVNNKPNFDFPYTSITDFDSYKKDFIDSRVKKYKYNKSKIGDTNGKTSFTIDNLDFPLIVVE